MKRYKHLLIVVLSMMIWSCNEGIDPISKVDPGTDETAPAINIIYPKEGTQLKVSEAVTSINIEFEVSDDIEIQSVKVLLNGTEIAGYTEFKDYRRLVDEVLYENVTNGTHVLTINATDLEGKSTSKSVTFEKVPPYTPLFSGEVFYMPFEDDLMELVSQKMGTAVGVPGFEAGGFIGSSYKGATDAYVTFPLDGLNNSEFSAVFWYKINATPDRSGIINVSPVGEDRTFGFRMFREGNDTEQRFKLNVGTGSGETWNDGGTINPANNVWNHLAITISGTACAIYINGELAMEVPNTGIDWSGCDAITIGSGAPNFTYWDHKSDLSLYDELRIFSKALSIEEIQTIFTSEGGFTPGYQPILESETFYLPFDDDFADKISGANATVVGSPVLAGEGKLGNNSLAGATDSYLTFQASSVISNEFSATCWMKVNAAPDRAGVITIGPEDTDNAGYPDVQNKRTNGLRFFREGSGTEQRFKLNVGTGDSDYWNDGGTIDPSVGEWVHLAFTISESASIIYINGVAVSESAGSPIDWTGCNLVSIMSGAPRFTEWDHLSDLSYMDELRFFNKALTANEVLTIMNSN